MITQGWPLWAVRRATGSVYAVVGWDSGQAVGVELGPELDGRVAMRLDTVAFYTDVQSAWKAVGA